MPVTQPPAQIRACKISKAFTYNLSVNNVYLEMHFAQRDDAGRKLVECEETALKFLIADQ
jgi:hypothetical protein